MHLQNSRPVVLDRAEIELSSKSLSPPSAHAAAAVAVATFVSVSMSIATWKNGVTPSVQEKLSSQNWLHQSSCLIEYVCNCCRVAISGQISMSIATRGRTGTNLCHRRSSSHQFQPVLVQTSHRLARNPRKDRPELDGCIWSELSGSRELSIHRIPVPCLESSETSVSCHRPSA